MAWSKYFAPMEGITGYIFRNTFHKYYGGVDKYFAPFISPADNCAITQRERVDLITENNNGIMLVPQILTKKSTHFIDATKALMDMGYDEINLNLGCPSGTVCSKGKGAGFLSETDMLDEFLYDIYEFAKKSKIKISIKTRVGRFDEDEWEELLDIYNRYPVYELIVHPRIRADFYKGSPRMSAYNLACDKSKNPLIYNGDLFNRDDIEDIANKFPKTKGIMLGRGLLKNPELLLYNETFDYGKFIQFHNELVKKYREVLSPDKVVIFKMKELWTYSKELFPENERSIRNVLKAKSLSDYDIAVRHLVKNYI